jgi:apolipoprotein N-acyltransferase
MPGSVATAGDIRARLLLAGTSALLLTLAQPPFPLGWLAYVALLPYLVGLEGLRGRRAFAYGFGWGLAVNLLGLYWIVLVKTAALAAAVLYLAVLDGLFTVLLARIPQRRRGLVLPFLWTGFLFLKSAGQTGFPWLTLALSQTWSTAAIQLAPLAGAWLIDLCVAGVNGLLYRNLRPLLVALSEGRVGAAVRQALPAGSLAVAVLLYGHIVLAVGGAAASADLHRPAAPSSAMDPASELTGVPPWLPPGSRPLRVAAIQGSLRPQVKLAPQLLDYNLYLYERLSVAAAAAVGGEVDLLVWPETAVPQYLTSSLRARREVRRIQQRVGAPIITGAFAAVSDRGAARGYRYYNAAFEVGPTGISSGDAIYRKRILVPFGERVPYQAVLGWLKGLEMGWSDFSLGEERPMFGGGEGIPPLAVQICYESVFARLVRPQVIDGATVLSVITNDAWFGRTSGPYQHLGAAALRAAELRRPVIRAANSGISCLIDRWGQVHLATALFTKTAVVGRVWPEEGLTWYARAGDWLPWLAALVAVAALLSTHPDQDPVIPDRDRV